VHRVSTKDRAAIDAHARIVWDYHHVGHALAPADCIIVLGSHDTRVAVRAAFERLVKAGYTRRLLR
jgi:hypothetical protein